MFGVRVDNGAIGCPTCGSQSQGTTVALGAGSAFISGSQALYCLFIVFTTAFTA